jgi:hypothetical protein
MNAAYVLQNRKDERPSTDGSFYFADLDERGHPWHRIPPENSPLAVATCGLHAKTVPVQIEPRLQEVHCGECFPEEADESEVASSTTMRGQHTGAVFDMTKEPNPDERKFCLAGLEADDIRTIYFAIRQHIDTLSSDLDDATGEDYLYDIEALAKLTRWQIDLEEKFGHPDILSFG